MKTRITHTSVVVLSGGFDSCLSAAFCGMTKKDILAPIFFRYGQKNADAELQAANKWCDLLRGRGVAVYTTKVIDLAFMADLNVDCGLLQADVAPTNKNTYVAFRNGVMGAIATSYAEQLEASFVVLGLVKLPRGEGWPDTTKKFSDAFRTLTTEGTYNRIQIYTPLVDMTKAHVIQLFRRVFTPEEFAIPHSCNLPEPCGACAKCNDRKLSFKKAGIEDAMHYRNT